MTYLIGGHRVLGAVKPRFLAIVVAIAAVSMSTGCSDGRPERLPVSGQVLIDGKPLGFGFIRFVPTGARPSMSQIDEQGRFTLGCYAKDDGIIPGVHQVEVDAAESISSTQKRWHAPKKYSRYNTSGLTQEITEPTDSLVINLTWGGGKPFTEQVR